MPNELPQGMMSLTYHLAYTKAFRDLWEANHHDQVFEAFGLHLPEYEALRAEILELNDSLGTTNRTIRTGLARQWMELMLQDLLQRDTDPKILW